MATEPRRDQRRAVFEDPIGGPVHLLNLLKFKEHAEYADGRATELTGAQAYERYLEEIEPVLAGLGGGFTFTGPTRTLVIGDGDLEWDAIVLGWYPSAEAMRTMFASDELRAASEHRDAGLEHELMIRCLSSDQTGSLLGVEKL